MRAEKKQGTNGTLWDIFNQQVENTNRGSISGIAVHVRPYIWLEIDNENIHQYFILSFFFFFFGGGGGGGVRTYTFKNAHVRCNFMEKMQKREFHVEYSKYKYSLQKQLFIFGKHFISHAGLIWWTIATYLLQSNSLNTNVLILIAVELKG